MVRKAKMTAVDALVSWIDKHHSGEMYSSELGPFFATVNENTRREIGKVKAFCMQHPTKLRFNQKSMKKGKKCDTISTHPTYASSSSLSSNESQDESSAQSGLSSASGNSTDEEIEVSHTTNSKLQSNVNASFTVVPSTPSGYVLVNSPAQLKAVTEHLQTKFHNSSVKNAGVDLPMLTLHTECESEQLMVLQLGTVYGSWIFDCLKLGERTVCDQLKTLLEDEQIVKVVHNASCDAWAIQKCGVQLSGMIDTQLMHEIEYSSDLQIELEKLLEKHGLIHLSKQDMYKRINADSQFWSRRPLPCEVLQCLADDLLLVLQLGYKMRVASQGKIVKLNGRDTVPLWEAANLASCERVQLAVDSHKPSMNFDSRQNFRMRSQEVLAVFSPDAMVPFKPTHVEEQDVRSLLDILPKSCYEPLSEQVNWTGLTDVVLDVGRRPQAFYGKKRRFLFPDVCKTASIDTPFQLVTQEDIDEVIDSTGGLECFGSDNRACLDLSLHRISALKNRKGKIVGVTMRAGRTVSGSVAMIADILFGTKKSVLVLGEPGSGKTSIIREIAKCVAEKSNLLIVDTSNEIAGDGDVPHTCVGLSRRMQVPSLNDQSRVMVECVQNHTPECMVIDEIGRLSEVEAAKTVKQRGVRIIASAHGSMRKLCKNGQLKGLLGHTEHVILPGGVPKTIRISDPVFDVVVEITQESYNDWDMVLDTGRALDLFLEGKQYPVQRRIRDSITGRMSIISKLG